jgi:hypothetical protein
LHGMMKSLRVQLAQHPLIQRDSLHFLYKIE